MVFFQGLEVENIHGSSSKLSRAGQKAGKYLRRGQLYFVGVIFYKSLAKRWDFFFQPLEQLISSVYD